MVKAASKIGERTKTSRSIRDCWNGEERIVTSGIAYEYVPRFFTVFRSEVVVRMALMGCWCGGITGYQTAISVCTTTVRVICYFSCVFVMYGTDDENTHPKGICALRTDAMAEIAYQYQNGFGTSNFWMVHSSTNVLLPVFVALTSINRSSRT